MVAPLLLGLAATGGGLLADRSLRRGRQRNLIDAIVGANVGADGVGPSAPIGNAGQMQLLNFMRQNEPELGVQLATSLYNQNQQLEQTRYRQQLLNTVALDPQASSNLAIREGRETFEVREPSGGTVVVPVQGTDRYQDNMRQYDANVGILETLQEMQELAMVLPPGAAALDKDSPAAQRLNALQGNFIAYAKDADNLGALGQDVLEFAERIAPAGRDIWSVFASPEALVAALQTGGDRFARSLNRLSRETQYYQGVDPQLRERAREVGVRRGVWEERIGGFAEPARSTAAEAGRVAKEARDAGLQLLQEGTNRAQQAIDSGNPLALLGGGGTQQQPSAAPAGVGQQAADLINSAIGNEVANVGGAVLDAGGSMLQGDVVGAVGDLVSVSAPVRFARLVSELASGAPDALENLQQFLQEQAARNMAQ